MLTIVDTFSRFSPALEPRFAFRCADVVELLERVGRQVGLPATIRVAIRRVYRYPFFNESHSLT